MEHLPVPEIQTAIGGSELLLAIWQHRDNHRDDVEYLLEHAYPVEFFETHHQHIDLLEDNLPEFDDNLLEQIEERELVLDIFKAIKTQRATGGGGNQTRLEKLSRLLRSQYILEAVHILSDEHTGQNQQIA